MLDCACGIGLLAAGLAGAGYETQASDISPEMVARTRALGVAARVCAWEALEPTADFDAVLCVGNSLAHAQDRRAALRGFAVEASDASPAMVERTRALAARHGVDVPARVHLEAALGQPGREQADPARAV